MNPAKEAREWLENTGPSEEARDFVIDLLSAYDSLLSYTNALEIWLTALLVVTKNKNIHNQRKSLPEWVKKDLKEQAK